MKDILHKPDTLRSATATATIHMPAFCIELLRNRNTEKGDALEVARTAGILAAKRTWELLPFCHPLPLQHIRLSYELQETYTVIDCEVQVVSGTGVEMEALTGVSVAALTLYDMLKPHAERELRIDNIVLRDKTGGKSDYRRRIEPAARAAIFVISGGRKHDDAGQLTRENLNAAGCQVVTYEHLADSQAALDAALRSALADRIDLIVTVGGTGVSHHDRATETVRALLDRELPGMMEAARHYGQRRTPYAMLSRGIAGIAGRCLIVTLPGSTRGAQESWQAIATGLIHTLGSLRRSEA